MLEFLWNVVICENIKIWIYCLQIFTARARTHTHTHTHTQIHTLIQNCVIYKNIDCSDRKWEADCSGNLNISFKGWYGELVNAYIRFTKCNSSRHSTVGRTPCRNIKGIWQMRQCPKFLKWLYNGCLWEIYFF